MRTAWISGALAALAVTLAAGLSARSAAGQGPGDPARGGPLYVENCAVCHGVSGEGRVGASLQQFPGIRVDAALEQTIARGIPGSVMPAFAQEFGGPLTAAEVSDLAAYIAAAFAGTEPLEPLPTYVAPAITPLPQVQGDPSAGAVVYQANCAVCHGADGRGRIGQTLAKAWPSADPSAYIRQVTRDGMAGTTMPAWGAARGGPLSDADIADVAAFVLTFQPAPAATPAAPAAGPISLTTGLIGLGVLVALAVAGLLVYYRRA